MAFWKKSEDPWDMKPKSVGTVNPVTPDRNEEPETLLESVRDWAEKKRSAEKDQLTLPPEKCCSWRLFPLCCRKNTSLKQW